jgi:hypothetical protein
MACRSSGKGTGSRSATTTAASGETSIVHRNSDEIMSRDDASHRDEMADDRDRMRFRNGPRLVGGFGARIAACDASSCHVEIKDLVCTKNTQGAVCRATDHLASNRHARDAGRCVGSDLRPPGLTLRGCFAGFSGSGGGAGRSSNASLAAPSSSRGAATAGGVAGLRCLRWATASSVGDALVELGDLLDESGELSLSKRRVLRAMRRVLRAQRFDVDLDDNHDATRSHTWRSLSIPTRLARAETNPCATR